MGREYYYLDGEEQKGPLTVEQLKSVGIKPDTFVWAEGMNDWKPAKEVEELKSIFRQLPPPPPQTTSGNRITREELEPIFKQSPSIRSNKSVSSPSVESHRPKWPYYFLAAGTLVIGIIIYNESNQSSTGEPSFFSNLFSKSEETQQGDCARQYKSTAEQGDAEAQYNLGNCYYDGEIKDYTQAAYWFGKAAEQGHADAQNRLGNCYYNDGSEIKNYEKAVYWYRMAAEQGNAIAQCKLGMCYTDGNGVKKDYRQAVNWYRKAAEQGNAMAQRLLGNCYSTGEGISVDNKQAMYWYHKAAEQGDVQAQVLLGACYEGIKDYEQAIYWYEQGLKNDNGDLQEARTLAEKRIRELKNAGYSSGNYSKK